MYQNERAFFTLYKEGLETDRPLFDEVLGAIAEVLSRYNTTVFENRFIVGGVVEQIIGASARALGLNILNAGKQNQGYDLELDGSSDTGISIKGVFASMSGKHNLVNTRGSNEGRDLTTRWTTSTIFVMSGVGIGYTDPELGGEFLHPTADALQISGGGLQRWWNENPEWIIRADIPRKPTGPATRVASDAVAWDVFGNFERLKKNWSPEI
jgi:hypothetical protein